MGRFCKNFSISRTWKRQQGRGHERESTGLSLQGQKRVKGNRVIRVCNHHHIITLSSSSIQHKKGQNEEKPDPKLFFFPFFLNLIFLTFFFPPTSFVFSPAAHAQLGSGYTTDTETIVLFFVFLLYVIILTYSRTEIAF